MQCHFENAHNELDYVCIALVITNHNFVLGAHAHTEVPCIRVIHTCVKCVAIYLLHVSVYTTYNTCITQGGTSPLQLAAMMGKTDVVVELVKNGANLNLQNKVFNNVQL